MQAFFIGGEVMLANIFQDFYEKILQPYYLEIIIALCFLGVAIVLLILFSKMHLLKETKKKQNIIIALCTIMLVGLNYILISQLDEPTKITFFAKYTITISPVARLIIINVAYILLYGVTLIAVYKKDESQKQEEEKKITTSNVVFLGIMISVASVLMFFNIPIMPSAPFLKVELSGLIIFMVLLWLGMKEAVIVSLVTNILHVYIGAGTPIIPFLDEMTNFIATMIFIFPSYLYLQKSKTEGIQAKGILFSTILGTFLTTVFMILYNAFFNLPIVYNMHVSFGYVMSIFGLFNIIKWGLVAISINLLWKKLYALKDIVHK